ncbi:YdcF family protein [filamentous cyanobacterium CCP1]|nr:YdcF family protein [filamentous cyanobacterium CCP2]PSB60291.1 YdcF family protein [filamentous cyanobacterium CCP1]
MLTLLTCPEVTDSWVSSFAGWVSRWIMQPAQVMLVFGGLLLVSKLLPKRRGRSLRLAMLCLTLSYLFALSPMVVNVAGKVLESQIPGDSGATADAIVILGRGKGFTPSRVAVANELWQAQRAPLIFASGIEDAPKILQRLQEQGIPRQALQGEACSRTTYENAKFTAAILLSQGVHQILLITDSPHMMRSMLTFRGFGFSITPVASSGLSELDRRKKTSTVLREWARLVGYGLLGRYAPQEIPSELASRPTLQSELWQPSI